MTSFTICVSYEDFDELESRLSLLAEALDVLDGCHLPCTSKGVPGTVIGVTLDSHPAGKKFIEDARVGRSRAELTIEKLKPFETLLTSFAKALDAVTCGFASCDAALLESLKSLMMRIHTSFQKDFGTVLAAYAPHANTPAVHAPFADWLSKVWTCQVRVFEPILAADLSCSKLSWWVGSCKATIERCRACSSSTLQARSIFPSNSSLAANIEQAHHLMVWLHLVAAFLCDERTEGVDKKELQKGFKLHLKPFLSIPDMPCLDIVTLAKSPVFGKDGEYSRGMQSYIDGEVERIVKPIATAFKELFGGPDKVRLLDTDTLSIEQLEAVKDGKMDTSAYDGAVKWAKDTADELLHLQLRCIPLIFELRKAFAQLILTARRCLAEGSKFRVRRISVEQVEVIHLCRSRLNGFIAFVDQSNHIFDTDVANNDSMHVKLLDTFVDLKGFSSSAQQETGRIESLFGQSWTKDLDQCATAITAFSPQWQLRHDTLLTDPEMVSAFLNMPDAHLDSIGPVTTELSNQIKILNTVTNGPQLVELSCRKRAQEMLTFGVETVIFKAVIVCTQRDWHNLVAPAEAAKAVEELQAKIKPKKVQLTAQMEECLASWASGAKITELESARDAARIASATGTVQAVPDGPAKTEAGSGSSEGRELPPAAGTPRGTADAEMAVQEIAGTAESSTGTKRASLASRAAAAKRNKMV